MRLKLLKVGNIKLHLILPCQHGCCNPRKGRKYLPDLPYHNFIINRAVMISVQKSYSLTTTLTTSKILNNNYLTVTPKK